MNNPSILYWKWDEQIFSSGVMEAKLDDILRRSSFSMLYVSFHHLNRPFEDAELLALITRCAHRLDKAGRRLLLDIDVRNEAEGMKQSNCFSPAKYIRFETCILDDAGEGHLVVKNPVRRRTGREELSSGPVRVAGCWCFEMAKPGLYKAGTLRQAKCQYEVHGDTTQYAVAGGCGAAQMQALIASVYEAAIPDLGAETTFLYYESLFEQVAGLPLGGAANDEWGYDLALQCDDGLFYVTDFPFTDTLADAYQKETGRTLDADCVHLAYAEEGREGTAYGIVNRYLQLLRLQMRNGNDWFYDAVKRHFGPDAFVGVHPTLWGDPTDFVLDVPHNGISWWETRRDAAQTDEFVLMPIRLALAHKWSRGEHPVFYNMWYSGNTQQFDTYLEETWKNARYGGRTHYLGYECPNEGGIYKLKEAGALEAIDRMENSIEKLDTFQQAMPDCRVLVVFGMEAASNWLLAGNGACVKRNAGALSDILHYVSALFDHYLCDLAPTSEIVDGSVEMKNGVVCYGSQQYDAVIWIGLENTDPRVHAFFARYASVGGRLVTVGHGFYWNDGSSAGDFLGATLPSMSCHLDHMDSIYDTVKILQFWGIAKNQSEHGVLYQDGSMIFTCKGRLPDRNLLDFTETLGGHVIRFVGEDFLGLRFTQDGHLFSHVSGKTYLLCVDDIELWKEEV